MPAMRFIRISGRFWPYPNTGCGRSSGVEHNLAKVGVVSSNLIARSNIKQLNACKPLFSVAFLFFGTSSKRFAPHFGVVFGSFLG